VGAVLILDLDKLLKAVHMLLTPYLARSASGLRVETVESADKKKSSTLFFFPIKKTLTKNRGRCCAARQADWSVWS
jgi:hypothetical protein